MCNASLVITALKGKETFWMITTLLVYILHILYDFSKIPTHTSFLSLNSTFMQLFAWGSLNAFCLQYKIQFRPIIFWGVMQHMLVPIYGERIAPIFKGQDGNNRLLPNIAQQLPTYTARIPQKRRCQLYHSRSLEMSNTIYCTKLIFTYCFFFWSSWCPYGLLQRMEELETKTIFLRWSFNDLASIQKNRPNPVVTLKDT